MFIGHYSASFVAAAHPKAPQLGTLFVAAQLVDIAFFSFVPMGIEHMRIVPGASAMNPMDLYDLPWTHSLLGALGWATGFAILLRLALGNWRAGAIGGAVVLSHWFLDLLVHVPDLTLAGTPPKLGFGLWNHPAVAMPLEIGLLMVGLFVYERATRATGKPWLLAALVVVLFGLQAINWFGAPPTAVDAGVWALGLFAFVLAAALAWWVGQNRTRTFA